MLLLRVYTDIVVNKIEIAYGLYFNIIWTDNEMSRVYFKTRITKYLVIRRSNGQIVFNDLHMRAKNNFSKFTRFEAIATGVNFL